MSSLRYDPRTGEHYVRNGADEGGWVEKYDRGGPSVSRLPYQVDQWDDRSGRWTMISHGRTLEQALDGLGGDHWFQTASPDRYRIRLPDGATIAPLGQSRGQPSGQQYPQREEQAGPHVAVSVPVPQPVRHQRTVTPSENSPMNTKYTLARGGQPVREFDTAAEAERAAVHYRRCDPAGGYHVVGGQPTRFARGERQEDQPGDRKAGTSARTSTSARDLGPPQAERWTVEMQDDDGQWVRVADSFPSNAEAQAELRQAAKEEGGPDVQMRVRRLSDDEPDELPDDDFDDDQDGTEFDPDNPGYFSPDARGGTASGDRLGRGGNYPDPTPPGRGGDGDRVPGGPRNPEEAQRVAKFARSKGISAKKAWRQMGGR